jgi:hypothetical protein
MKQEYLYNVVIGRCLYRHCYYKAFGNCEETNGYFAVAKLSDAQCRLLGSDKENWEVTYGYFPVRLLSVSNEVPRLDTDKCCYRNK